MKPDEMVAEYPDNNEPAKVEEENDETSDDKEESDGAGEEEVEEDEDDDMWREVIEYACEMTGKPLTEGVIQEPYLSQFVDHMKNFVESRIHFVRAMENDEDYKKIDQMIDTFESDDYDRDEAVDTAWHNRRFLVKRIIERNMSVVEEQMKENDVDDSAEEKTDEYLELV